MYPDLYPHQKAVLNKIQNGNILWGGVGSGKSRVAMAYYVLNESPKDLIIITTAKKRDSLDWEEEAVKFGIGKETNATVGGVLHVDSWNNLHKYLETTNQFFVFDEARAIGSGQWSKWFLKIARKNNWIMLSATPGDTWMDYIPVFIANGFYRNRTEFKRQHVIYNSYAKFPKVERYVDVGILVKHRNDILVHMPYTRHTTRHSVNVWTEYDEEMMTRVAHGRWNIYKDEPIRDVAELFGVMRRVVNDDWTRAQAVSDLTRKHEKLIVFYNFNYELDVLRTIGGTLWSDEEIPTAEWNGHKHEPIPDTSRWLYLVQYAAGAEGWNCVSTDAMCFYSLPYSYKLWEQAHGRIDRLNTPFKDLYYYTLRSKAPIDWSIWRSLRAKKSFQFDHFDMTNSEFADFSVTNE